MFVSKKYLVLVIAVVICCFPVMIWAAEKDNKSANSSAEKYEFGDDIQAMVTLRYGSRGEDVKLIQTYLIRNGFLKDKADGMFGKLTLQAVKEFQKFIGVPVDGLVGGQTYRALKNYQSVVAEDPYRMSNINNTSSAPSAGEALPSVKGAAPTRVEQVNDDSALNRRKMSVENKTSRGDVSRVVKTQEVGTSKNIQVKESNAPVVKTVQENLADIKSPALGSKPKKNPEVGNPNITTSAEIPGSWRPIRLEATAYTMHDAGCTAYTYRENYLHRGLVAVDPAIIPLGTRLFVPGYGYAIADDIGGAIKGHKIDLAMDTLEEAFAYGRRTITAYIIDWTLLT